MEVYNIPNDSHMNIAQGSGIVSDLTCTDVHPTKETIRENIPTSKSGPNHEYNQSFEFQESNRS